MEKYQPLQDSQTIEFVLDDEDVYDDPGSLREYSDGRPAKAKDELRIAMTVEHQIHGGFEPGDNADDNASLLVLKFTPKPKRECVVLHLVIELRLRIPLVDDDDDDETDYGEDELAIHTFEPASRGVQTYGERVTDVTRQRGLKGTLSIPTPGPTIGLEGSASETGAFKWHDQLTVRAGLEKVDVNDKKKNLVRWTVDAASEDVGIGDSLTVAVLVRRPPGTQFCLDFTSDGRLGSWAGTIMKPFSFLKRKRIHPMGIYGPRPRKQTIPGGVLENNLRAAIKDAKVLRALKVGLHLPEALDAVKYYAVEEEKVESTVAASVSVAGSQPAEEKGTVAAQAAAGWAGRTTTHWEPPAAPASGLAPPDNGAGRAGALLEQAGRLAAMTTGPVSASGVPDVSGVPSRPQGSASLAQRTTTSRRDARRAERHRMMAALYERLARLHREEAEELSPPNEDETAFVDSVLRSEIGS